MNDFDLWLSAGSRVKVPEINFVMYNFIIGDIYLLSF